MRNAVEEGPDVKVDSPILFPAALSGHGQRVMGTTPRTITVTIRVEDWFQRFFQQHRCRGLGDAVRHIRHAEYPDPGPMILWYLHRTHRPREITPRGHPVPQPVKVIPFPGCELGDANGVHARRPLVGPDLHPRPVNEAFVDLKRLHRRLWSAHQFLPRRVGHQGVNPPGFAGDSVSWEGWGHVEKIWELPEGAAGPCCSDGGGGSVGACFGSGRPLSRWRRNLGSGLRRPST